MDLQLELQHLAEAERHVIEGRETVERQRQLVARLVRDGHDAKQAKALLNTFLETQAAHEVHLVRIQQELGEEADLCLRMHGR
jgi:hypothetical protein